MKANRSTNTRLPRTLARMRRGGAMLTSEHEFSAPVNALAKDSGDRRCDACGYVRCNCEITLMAPSFKREYLGEWRREPFGDLALPAVPGKVRAGGWQAYEWPVSRILGFRTADKRHAVWQVGACFCAGTQPDNPHSPDAYTSDGVNYEDFGAAMAAVDALIARGGV